MFRVSIIGQDAKSLEGLVRNLGQSGFSCSLTNDSEVAVASVLEQSPDIVLVENDSYYRISEVSREIRRASDVPIVAIVRGDLLSRVNGHFNKVHDFVAKPFHPEELQLRMKRLLRRAGADGEEILKSGELTIDMARCEVFVGDRAVLLTYKEYELLKFLVSNQGRVCTRDVLLDKVWGLDYYGGDRTVDVHIRRLRSKIEDATHVFIDTVRNIGYRFRAER